MWWPNELNIKKNLDGLNKFMDFDKKAQYLYKASHYVTSNVLDGPEILGSTLISKFEDYLHAKNLSYEKLNTEYCPNCSTIFIPGINLQMRCIYKKSKVRKEPKKKRERKLRFLCLSCNTHTDHEINQPKEDIVITDSTSIKVSKNKSKSKKKNTLLHLMNERKQQEEDAKKKSGILSLEEFMKN